MIIGFIIIAVLVLWSICIQHRLVGMNENINHSMSQIGVQLSSRMDALIALVNILKEYDVDESQTLMETIKSHSRVITSTATPEDVRKQENMISEVLDRISKIVQLYPETKTNDHYAKCVNAIDNFEKMIQTSRLIYNDHVTRLNRELRMFPTFLIAALLGFHEREHLEAVEEANMSSIR